MKNVNKGWTLIDGINMLQLSRAFPMKKYSLVFIPNEHFHYLWPYSDKYIVNKV